MDIVVESRDLYKRFGAFVAVDRVSFLPTDEPAGRIEGRLRRG